ncbi:hypothetical protein BRC80_06140 [Halobacteriales archaeon QH_9_66_26]|nr:MAG: hypothetical protein BRC80_06140 [Halobacteriales archaeon QH_9_66_26]
MDRGAVIADAAGETPVVGERAVRSLVTEVGLDDPEDSRVNCLLEGLRLTRERRDEGEEPVLAAVSAPDESVDSDRAIAQQIDDLLADHPVESAVVVTDNAADERLVHVIESRVRVDGVSRVVVRQARDLESTYYLLKQFLADEQLRTTVLVPIGLFLLAVPVLVAVQNVTVALATIASVAGLFLLYKGLGVDDALAVLAGVVRDGLYTGRVSIVTTVVAAGLALVGIVAGVISATPFATEASALTTAMAFLFDSVPWLAIAALTASVGRALDEWLRNARVGNATLNLPFVVVAVAFVVRGFAAYFLERAGVIEPLTVPPMALGIVSVQEFAITSDIRLVAFIVAGVCISLLGVGVAARLGDRLTVEGSAESS